MLRILGSCALMIVTGQAWCQERVVKDNAFVRDTAALGQFFEKTLPAIVTKEGARRCEFYQYPVECIDVGISTSKLLAATKKADRSSFPAALAFLEIKADGPKKKLFVRFPLIGSPVPPAIPFVAYDGEKNHFFVALDELNKSEKVGRAGKETDPYLQKVERSDDDPRLTAFDPAFDKGTTIADTLAKQKKDGFKFIETSWDEGFELTFAGLRRAADVAASELAIEYWQEFYNRSSKRALAWGQDCIDCAIVRKTEFATNFSVLEYCRVQIAAGRRSAPEKCAPVVVFQPDGVWLRAAVTFEYPDGFGGGDSGYELDCLPIKGKKDAVAWTEIADDISKTIEALDYIPVKSRHNDEQKFLNEFGKSKLYPEKNYEWTTVTTGFIPPAKDQMAGFYVTLNVNFSLLPEVDPSRYRPSIIPEEVEGLHRLGALFKDRYGCTVAHNG